MFSRLMHITLFVSDQDKGLDFYNSFGFQKRVDFSGLESRFLTIALEDQKFEIVRWPGAARGRRRRSVISVPSALIVESDDLRKTSSSSKRGRVKFAETQPDICPCGIRLTPWIRTGAGYSCARRENSKPRGRVTK
jgi:hypothetical protein